MAGKFLIGRPIGGEGITLNGMEYVLDGENGEVMEYNTQEKALEFLNNETGRVLTALAYEEEYGYYIMEDEDQV